MSLFAFLLALSSNLKLQVSLQCLGAAVAVAIPLVPAWNAAYAEDSIGELFVAILAPAGGFGKFLVVLISLNVTANIAPTMYSFGMSFQVFIPFCVHLPRYLFSVFAAAVYVFSIQTCGPNTEF